MGADRSEGRPALRPAPGGGGGSPVSLFSSQSVGGVTSLMFHTGAYYLFGAFPVPGTVLCVLKTSPRLISVLALRGRCCYHFYLETRSRTQGSYATRPRPWTAARSGALSPARCSLVLGARSGEDGAAPAPCASPAALAPTPTSASPSWAGGRGCAELSHPVPPSPLPWRSRGWGVCKSGWPSWGREATRS